MGADHQPVLRGGSDRRRGRPALRGFERLDTFLRTTCSPRRESRSSPPAAWKSCSWRSDSTANLSHRQPGFLDTLTRTAFQAPARQERSAVRRAVPVTAVRLPYDETQQLHQIPKLGKSFGTKTRLAVKVNPPIVDRPPKRVSVAQRKALLQQQALFRVLPLAGDFVRLLPAFLESVKPTKEGKRSRQDSSEAPSAE